MRSDRPAPPAFDPRAAGWEPIDSAGFIELVGPFWQRRDQGRLHYGFMSEPRHANLVGVVQGGMLMTFADRVLGLALMDETGGAPCVTVQFETKFIAPAPLGAFVEIAPQITSRAGSLVFLGGVVTVAGRPVASASGIWKVLRPRATGHGPTGPRDTLPTGPRDAVPADPRDTLPAAPQGAAPSAP